jgi:O-antigen/teichoic acid export membrane protein
LNSKAVSFIKNFSYTLTSNLVSLLVSALVILVVPKLIGVEEYGYWQLYLFYSSYVGFMHFGWNDGIYLRYGGKEYKELDKSLFFSQFYMLVILQLIIAIIMFIIANSLIIDGNKSFILKMTAICMIILNVRYMLLFILQGTNITI